jgi:hypothetical protein
MHVSQTCGLSPDRVHRHSLATACTATLLLPLFLRPVSPYKYRVNKPKAPTHEPKAVATGTEAALKGHLITPGGTVDWRRVVAAPTARPPLNQPLRRVWQLLSEDFWGSGNSVNCRCKATQQFYHENSQIASSPCFGSPASILHFFFDMISTNDAKRSTV